LRIGNVGQIGPHLGKGTPHSAQDLLLSHGKPPEREEITPENDQALECGETSSLGSGIERILQILCNLRRLQHHRKVAVDESVQRHVSEHRAGTLRQFAFWPERGLESCGHLWRRIPAQRHKVCWTHDEGDGHGPQTWLAHAIELHLERRDVGSLIGKSIELWHPGGNETIFNC
jgi:hypothetical protein